jgi:hypothetical protein
MKTQPDQKQLRDIKPVDEDSCTASGFLLTRVHSSGEGQEVNLASESVAGEEDPGASLDMAAGVVCAVDSATAQPLSAPPPNPVADTSAGS